MEKKYCIHCGAENSLQADICIACGKKTDPVENLLMDWLYSHTKDKFKDEAEASMYDAVKKWIMSHLYGMTLSITLLASVISAAGGGTGYITPVDSFPGTDTPEIVTPVTPDMPDEDEREILSLSDRLYITVEGYLDAVNNSGGVMTDEVRALMVPQSLGLNGYFEAFTDRWTNDKEDTSAVQSSYSARNHSTMWVEPSRVYLALQEMGYTPYYATGYNALYNSTVNEGAADIVFQYLFTVVEIDGRWYVAETLEYGHDRAVFNSELRQGESVYTSPDMM